MFGQQRARQNLKVYHTRKYKKKKKKKCLRRAGGHSHIFPLRLTFNGTDGRADDLIHRTAQYRLSLSLRTLLLLLHGHTRRYARTQNSSSHSHKQRRAQKKNNLKGGREEQNKIKISFLEVTWKKEETTGCISI